MPLFDGNPESEFAETINSPDECTQSGVALLIELAIVEEFVESFLLASLEHFLKSGKGYFGNQELVMVSVMTRHLSLFYWDFRNASVIGSIQVLKLDHKLVTFSGELRNNVMDLVNLRIISQGFSFERGYLDLELIHLLRS